MQKLVKKLIPEPFLRRLRAKRVQRNRRAIVSASRRGAPVVLVPDTVVEHFYHFLLDLSLPLYLAIEASPPEATFVLKTTGPFLPRLQPLFPTRLTIADPAFDTKGLETQSLVGMNPFFVDVTQRDLLAFSRHVRSTMGVSHAATRNKVLMIERLPPQEFFETAARSKGGGTRRRSIPNHEALVTAVEGLIRPGFEFQNVQLERLTFEEQVQLFAGAALVVGQHGAGLANCLWMAPEGKVVELTNNPALSHFQVISAAMGQAHVIHQTDGAHAPINIDRLVAQLKSDARLADVVRA